MAKDFRLNLPAAQNQLQPEPLVQLGERIVSQVKLSEAEISQFAQMCGDSNPLHHDPEYARRTRFGCIIVCGPHITSLMMALTAEYFCQHMAMVGLGFSFQFLKAIKAEELVNLEWEVVATQNKASLGGEVVELKGKVTNEQGLVVLTGTGKILVTVQL